MLVKDLYKTIEALQYRSAWDKGVNEYALELVDLLDENADFTGAFEDRAELLNGAKDWNQYSWGGCSLICDCDIAERLCTPSELKRCKGGENRLNSREEWLDVQARALFQASNRVRRVARDNTKKEA